MKHNRLSSILLVPLLAVTACDALGPDRSNTRVALSSFAAVGPSFSVSSTGIDGATDGKVSSSGTTLALVEDLAVTVTAVQALPAQYLDYRDLDGRWETLTLAAPATVNLLSLPSDPDAAVTLVEGDLPPGAYVRMRPPADRPRSNRRGHFHGQCSHELIGILPTASTSQAP